MPDADAPSSLFWLHVESKGEMHTIFCHGKLVAGVTDHLYATVRKLIPGATHITLDLTDLKHMDSMGLGTIVHLYVSARTAGCTLQLVHLSTGIRHLLGVTNLLSVLTDLCEKGVAVRF